MTRPFVGLPEGTGDRCAFSAHLDQPACAERATVHLLSDSAGWGLVTLASCAQHLPLARAAAVSVSEHAFHADCATNACMAVSS